MSAQNSRPKGVLSGVLGMFGFSVIAGVLVTVMVTPALAVTGVTASNGIGIFDSLPEFIEIGKQPQRNEIFAVNGVNPDGTRIYTPVAQVYSQNRQEVEWDGVSQFLKDATVAGEDRRFYEHGGVDLQGVIRAAVGNVSGGDTSGASTLSMQLVKNIYIQEALLLPTEEDRDKGVAEAQAGTFDRKIKEMKLAIGLEKKYSKDEILLAYLNIAGFGGNNYGIQSAAQRYYGVSAADVTLAQAASLIAIVQEPGARGLDSAENYQNNKDRRDVILRNMLVEGMIDQAQLDEALASPIDDTTVVHTPYTNGCIAAYPYATYFCDYVTKLIPELEALGSTPEARKAAWTTGGYKIFTSLDLRLQSTVQDTLAAKAPANETRLQLGAAATSVQVGTGRIITMAQNKTYDNSEAAKADPTKTSINYSTDREYGGSSGFQVGSTYKVFTLLNWLDSGRGLNEVVDGNARTLQQSAFTNTCTVGEDGTNDGPFGGTWTFKNSAGEKGNRTVMAATAASINGAYASMGLELDQCKTKQIAESLGVHPAITIDNPDTDKREDKLESNPSGILGTNTISPLTMAAAYAGIANHGIYCKPIAVDGVTDADGNQLPGQAQDCKQAIDPEVAATTVFALQNAMKGYAGNPQDGTPIFGKTGTTDSSNQTWLMSSTSALTTAVWFGNIVGDYPISRYPGGINNRHTISKPINQAADKLYPGTTFDTPVDRLVKGASVTLPDFVGGTAANAQALLSSNKLTYVDAGQIDSDLPAGAVAATDPAAGTIMARGQSVSIFTSNGALKGLPDVVSSAPLAVDAVATLASAGYTNVTQTCVKLAPADAQYLKKVVSSNPTPGAVTRLTDPISLGVGC
ncbi:transglycosylase domain-containing protein [Conyzicola nivalis]|uniref:transglycosylase domain-containing protein n=1 Tax=Conyzicola nivalis TaxID=1477021 RepID=UPI00166B9DEA|nr:transglycosylase domain-containing protein [Conyzicola nivalis]